jgi:hypothetical protein
MNRYGMGTCALGCLMALALPCAAQEGSQNNRWNGSWKADSSSMKYDGPTVSIATSADGYTITREGKPTRVVCDGKPNAPVNGTVTSCTKTPTGYALENTREGKPDSHVKVDISPDGATMTRVAEIINPEGAPNTITLVSKRSPVA